jgi:hypothetical protein
VFIRVHLWLISVALTAGPVEFGMQEFDAAVAAKNLKIKVTTELSLDPPEAFRIEPYATGSGRVSGGDLRGLMYGLIEAAEQVRATGKLKAIHGVPSAKLRSVTVTAAEADIAGPWFSSDLYWRAYFQTLARARINRLELAVLRIDLLADVARRLPRLSAEYGVDFTVGLPPLSGDPAALRTALAAAFAAAPQLRGVGLDAEEAPLDLFKAGVLRALHDAGRRVTLDLRGVSFRPEWAQAALDAGVALRVSADSACDDHFHIIETFCGPGNGFEFVMRFDGQPSPDPDLVRAQVAPLAVLDIAGFEIDVPRSLLGGDATAFYFTWGRLGYAPAKSNAPAAGPVQK